LELIYYFLSIYTIRIQNNWKASPLQIFSHTPHSRVRLLGRWLQKFWGVDKRLIKACRPAERRRPVRGQGAADTLRESSPPLRHPCLGLFGACRPAEHGAACLVRGSALSRPRSPAHPWGPPRSSLVCSLLFCFELSFRVIGFVCYDGSMGFLLS